MTPEETVRAECAAWGPRDLDEITSYFVPDAILVDWPGKKHTASEAGGAR